MTITSVLLQTIGPALLPVPDSVEFEYYNVLGLDAPTKKTLVGQVLTLSGSGSGSASRVSLADIRKAYKTQSLQWHPDKVAQRRHQQRSDTDSNNNTINNTTENDPALVYERIQEAATVLQDDTQRTLYHEYGCSVARYRFVAVAHGLSNPSAVVDNIAHAPWGDKTRLLLVTTTVLMLVWIQPILVATKINHENKSAWATASSSSSSTRAPLDSVSWLVILVPTWLLGGLFLILTGLITGTVISQQQQQQKGNGGPKPKTAVSLLTDPTPILLMMQWLEGVLVMVGIIVLAWYWDERSRRHQRDANRDDATTTDDTDLNWRLAALSWWLCIVLRLARALWHIQMYKRALSTMHSVEYIQTTEGIDSSEWEAVHRDYDQDPQERSDDDEENNPTDAAAAAAQQQGNTEPRLVQLRETVAQRYIVVHADPMLVAQVLQAIRDETNAAVPTTTTEQQGSSAANDSVVSPDELEAIRVQSSAEYQSVEATLRESYTHMGQFVLIYVPLLALIVAKLNHDKDDFASWWVVFVPLWLRLGLPWLFHFFSCCCSGGGGVPGEYDVTDTADSHPGNEMPGSTTKESTEPPPSTTTTATQVNRDGTTTETTTTTTTSRTIATTSHHSPPLQSKSSSDDVLWASPEGDIAEFNVERATGSSEKTAESEAKYVNTKPQATNAESGGNCDDDDDDMPELDQEAFRKWQKRMEESEMDDMVENRLKAFSNCCFLSFQLMMLCLIVAKLEHDSDIEGGDVNTGFNAFWVLFPLLLFSGIILLCCSCSIYAKPRADDEEGTEVGGAEATAMTPVATSAAILSPPPPVQGIPATDDSHDETPLLPPNVDHAAVSTTQGTADHDGDMESSGPAHPLSAKVDVETGGNMDDLD